MTESPALALVRILDAHHETLLTTWMERIQDAWRQKPPPSLLNTDLLRPHSRQLLAELRHLFATGLPPEHWEPGSDSPIAQWLHELSLQHAKHNIPYTDTIKYVTVLKHLLLDTLLQETTGTPPDTRFTLFMALDRVLDRLVQCLCDGYLETRERIIAQQSLSLLELSTPVVRLWDRVVMVPLIGIIDTQRARQITERLLNAIAQYEAVVAILDVTGVPVLDTSVAGHLMKTIAAARLLGAHIVMTGISPDGAQTLVKLGIDFANITTRATLRAGIAEGLLLIGKRIVSIK